MRAFSRRELLTWFALTPTLPHFLVQSARAASLEPGVQTKGGYDGRIVVIVRMLGGNDGLNAVDPVRDDRYYKARPTIAIARQDAIAVPGGDLGLNPWLSDFRRLMDDGHAGIVQGVGYPSSSRSHLRSTEIWETGSVADPAPAEGWLGRYLDHACECGPEPLAGVQFGESLGRSLASRSGRSQAIGNTQLLLEMSPATPSAPPPRGSRSGRLDYLRQVENSLGDASRQLHKAVKGGGHAFDYPNTPFGQSLRWTADMIETGCPTRVYYVGIESFDTPTAASFDTHIGQLDKHKILFSELGRGLTTFRNQLRRAGHLDRVLLLTFSDFGRQVAENRTEGTDHGDASVLFFMGGAVRAGLLGRPADLGKVHDGGLDASVDFRQIYADVLSNWRDDRPGNGARRAPRSVHDRRADMNDRVTKIIVVGRVLLDPELCGGSERTRPTFYTKSNGTSPHRPVRLKQQPAKTTSSDRPARRAVSPGEMFVLLSALMKYFVVEQVLHVGLQAHLLRQRVEDGGVGARVARQRHRVVDRDEHVRAVDACRDPPRRCGWNR